MAKKSNIKFIGLALIIIGAGLMFWGYRMSDSVASQLTQAITGSDTDKVIAFYIAGVISMLAGLFVFLKNR
ncbi:MAG: DUF3185 family protein [Sulfurimonas sp.]|nr:DUF3185 family protein [Sulfurimonas sp.]